MRRQFEVWLVNLNPSRGTEPGKIQPAVIIQTNLLNQVGHPSTLICPVTSQVSSAENILRVRISSERSGLVQKSEILVDQVRSLDNRRFLEKLRKIDNREAKELLEKLRSILDF